MEADIISYQAEAEYFTDELCFINELSNSSSDPNISIAKARVKPGITTRWHRLHNTVERYVILEGEALVEVGGLPPQKVCYGDVVLIPAECRQRITNTGTTDLIFLAICTPRFKQEFYEDINGEYND